ncbi:zinc finger protein 41-like [Trichogramma pretiosum]|uniref:zinc finger protein 41-like n=1 Tax=Trichogramma pretiosum TaxID=7493 RepID=UPI000C719A32|nr:zinc finger protein 41-like [Trichogramma pretiosum]
MESSNMFDSAVRVEEEYTNALLLENICHVIDEKPDLKHFQLLPLLPENLIHTLPKCDNKLEKELDDKVEIVVECEDVKPNINLLSVKKIDDDSQNHLQITKNGDICKDRNKIKIDPAEEVKQEFVGDDAGELNFNFNCEHVEQNRQRRTQKRINNKHNLKTNIDTAHNNKTNACKIRGKKLANKPNLDRHVISSHNHITYACNICGKNFSTKGNLSRHVKSSHDHITHACEICGKKFSHRSSLSRHVTTSHKCIIQACEVCEKTFTQKNHLKTHIDVMHNGVTHACEICGKKFSNKSNVKKHIVQVHTRIKHTCVTCGKIFSCKGNLKTHIDSVHDKIAHRCDICGKKYSLKSDLIKHIDVMHNGVIHACEICGKKLSKKSNLKKHIDAMHNGSDAEVEPKILELKKRLQIAKETFQPLIIAVGRNLTSIESYHIAVNDQLYELSNCLETVVVALKIFFSLDCEYPENTQVIWKFLQQVLLNIKEEKSMKTRANFMITL